MITLRDWPWWAKLVGALTTLYVAVFQLPKLAAAGWIAGKTLVAGNLSTGGFILLSVVFSLLGAGIWVLSVWLAGRGYHATRKPAYAFLLIYLLIGAFNTPFYFASQWLNYRRFQERVAALPAEQRAAAEKLPVVKPSLLSSKIDLSLPVGPTLLLLMVAGFCFSDGVPVPRRLPFCR